jgi:hypothetical protein
VLTKHKMKVHGVKSEWFDSDPKSFSSDADAKNGRYDDASGKGTGYPRQFEYDKAVGACGTLPPRQSMAFEHEHALTLLRVVAGGVADKFFECWEKMLGENRFLDLKSRLLPAKDNSQSEGGPAGATPPDGKVFVSNLTKKKYTLKEGTGFDGLWLVPPPSALALAGCSLPSPIPITHPGPISYKNFFSL